MNFELEIDMDEQVLYIGTENGTGCEYSFNNTEDLLDYIREYIENAEEDEDEEE